MKQELQKFHNTVLDIHEKSAFTEVLREEHINSNRKMIAFNKIRGGKTSDKYDGYFALKNGQKYFITTELHEQLPIKINNDNITKLIDNDHNLIYKPNSVKSFRIIPAETFERQQFLREFMPVDHSNPDGWLVFKLLCIACEVGKLGLCISTEKGFGKTNIFKVLGHTCNMTHVIPPGTYKGMLSRINGKGTLVIDEIIDMEIDKKKSLKRLTLNLLGADDNIKNEALRSKGTKDEYSTRDQSFVMLYNRIEDVNYQLHNFFDGLVADHPAIMDRVLKVRFNGMITSVWDKNFNLKECAIEHRDYYIRIAKYMEYLRMRLRSGDYNRRYSYNWTYNLTSRRAQMLMDITFIFDWFSLTQEEYEQRMKVLEDSMIDYDKAIAKAKV